KLHESWQQKTVDMGDICIQLCTGCSTVIWIPEEINKEQFSEFKSYVEEVKKVDKLLESNGEETLEFICNLEESKDIDEILELAKQRVVDVLKKQKDENIIVENTNRIGNNIFDISNLDLENIAADGKNVRIESDEFLKEKTLLEKSEKVEKNCEGVR
ncbi:MAG: hypothetical protein RSE00_05455, partial [Clostridia bacterium]